MKNKNELKLNIVLAVVLVALAVVLAIFFHKLGNLSRYATANDCYWHATADNKLICRRK